ncbi:protein of unknown function (plasmid) [Cupriavidus taiwanensis]|nr:protein of unknown function [Cupriavidus taiwanensis]
MRLSIKRGERLIEGVPHFKQVNFYRGQNKFFGFRPEIQNNVKLMRAVA